MDTEYELALKLRELVKHDTSSPVVEMSDHLLDEDLIIDKEISKKTPTVAIKQSNAYMENHEFHYCKRLTAKKHRNKKWRKAKRK